MTTLDAWLTHIQVRIKEATGAVVVIGRLPAEPARALAITAYEDTRTINPNDPMRTVRVQVRARQDKTAPTPTAHALAEQARDAITGHHPPAVGRPAYRVAHQSMADLGPDENGCHERTDNYTLTTYR